MADGSICGSNHQHGTSFHGRDGSLSSEGGDRNSFFLDGEFTAVALDGCAFCNDVNNLLGSHPPRFPTMSCRSEVEIDPPAHSRTSSQDSDAGVNFYVANSSDSENGSDNVPRSNEVPFENEVHTAQDNNHDAKSEIEIIDELTNVPITHGDNLSANDQVDKEISCLSDNENIRNSLRKESEYSNINFISDQPL